MGMYICKRCGFPTDDEDEASIHAYEEHGLEVEDCFSTEEEATINANPEPEENLDESEGLTEEEVKGAVVLENYEQIQDETLKKQVLSRALGQSVGSDKKFKEPIKLSEVDRAYLRYFSEKLSNGVCPECDRHYTQLGQALASETMEDLKEEIVLQHLSAEHPAVFEMIKTLFYRKEEPADPRVVPHDQTSNPENCSEEMTREELSQEIAASPELRAKLFRKWKALRETKNSNQ